MPTTPLPTELRLYLERQVDRHLTPEELHTAPGQLPFVRLLHTDSCRRCTNRRHRVLKADERPQRAG